MKPHKFDDYKTRYEHLSMERSEDGILQLTIHAKNDPTRMIDYGAEPYGWSHAHCEWSHCFNDIARDYDNEVVIITGAGGGFIGGEKTDYLPGRSPLRWDPIYQNGKFVQMNLLSIEVPIIGAVDGPALTHAELAVQSDIVICSDRAVFQDQPHFDNGVVPGDSVSLVWPLILGPNRGRYFLLTGQKIDAKKALELGVVSEVVAPERLLPRAWELAREILKRPRLVRRYARVAMTQRLKQLMLDHVGYGLAMEGLSAAVSWGVPPEKK